MGHQCNICGFRTVSIESYMAQERAAGFAYGTTIYCDRCKAIRDRDPALFDFLITAIDHRIERGTADLREDDYD